jgi:hypothetical protein
MDASLAAGKKRLNEVRGKHASEAKARRLFSCACGTTEVVPFQNLCWQRSFFPGCVKGGRL